MTDSNANLLSVSLFRMLQSALEAAPTLLCGILIAGLLRGMVEPARILKWFTDDPLIGPVRAFLIGFLLPICSLGVLPVAWEVRRAGVSRATVLTFVLAAPLADPFNLIYALQHLESQGPFGLGALLYLWIASFVVTVGTGVLIGRILPEPVTSHSLPGLPASGLRRIGIVILTAARGLTSVLFPIVVLALAGSGALAVVAGGALEQAADDRTLLIPLHMAGVSVPFYVPTSHGTAMVCDLLINGVSAGAVYVFLQLGVGLNLGTIAWIARSLGWRVLGITAVLVAGMVLSLCFALPFGHVNPAMNSVRDRQFFEIEASAGVKAARLRALKTTVTNEVGEPQWLLITACVALGTLSLIGVISHAVGERGAVTYWMTKASRPKVRASNPLNTPLGPSHIALAGMTLVLATIGAGLYIYYPPPTELLDEIDDLHVELALAIRSEPIPRQRVAVMVSQLQRLQRKLGVSQLLRQGRAEGALRQASDELGDALEKLKGGLIEGESLQELAPCSTAVRQAAVHCRDALVRHTSEGSTANEQGNR